MTDDDETILHDRPHKDPGGARAAKVVRARKLAKEISEMSDEAVDPVAFEKGYNDGKDDYLCGGNTPERVEEQIEWLKKVAENK